ncbi:hypothetical protein [Bacillus pinisoli]|uniref:hypothetical protein n=1 Tax=Bacillus pinisoli TaxID=2901866 RepID=UPI001FF2B5E9|nr:hypothetical protein [Bacillus pinisoli]
MDNWKPVDYTIDHMSQKVANQIGQLVRKLIMEGEVTVKEIDQVQYININDIDRYVNLNGYTEGTQKVDKLLPEIIKRLDDLQDSYKQLQKDSSINETDNNPLGFTAPSRNKNPRYFYPKNIVNQTEPFRKLSFKDFSKIVENVRKYYHLRIDPTHYKKNMPRTFSEYLYCYLYNENEILRGNIDHKRSKLHQKPNKLASSHKYYFSPLKKQYSSMKLLVLSVWESEEAILDKIIKDSIINVGLLDKKSTNDDHQLSLFN